MHVLRIKIITIQDLLTEVISEPESTILAITFGGFVGVKI